MAMDTLADLFEDELKDIYNAEHQLAKALPKMAKKASSETLKAAFLSHLEETEGHIERLEQIGQALDIKLTGKVCAAMKGLVEEGKEVIDEDGEGAVIDAALIGAAQRVEHYEMAAYGVTRALAAALGHAEAVELLQATLDEEGAADEKLTAIAEGEVLPAAASGGEEGEEEDSEEDNVDAETLKKRARGASLAGSRSGGGRAGAKTSASTAATPSTSKSKATGSKEEGRTSGKGSSANKGSSTVSKKTTKK